MARKKKQAPVISITGAARLLNLHPWQVGHVARKYQLVPQPPQPGQDRRCKWYPRDILLSLMQREQYRLNKLPVAS